MKLILITLTIILTTGCAEIAEYTRQIEERQQIIKQWVEDNSTPEVKRLIARRSFALGMNEIEVRASVGNPSKINKTVGSWGIHEQWMYYGYQIGSHRETYMYFENSILTSYQE